MPHKATEGNLTLTCAVGSSRGEIKCTQALLPCQFRRLTSDLRVKQSPIEKEEKFVLGGPPRIKHHVHRENFISLKSQRPTVPSLCGADYALGAQVISQRVQIT